MGEFKKIFKKVDGIKVLKEYLTAHVLIYALFMTAIQGFSKKSLELVRMSVSNRIVKRLRKKYKPFIEAFKNQLEKNNDATVRKRSNKVWICWLQGMEQAPSIVKTCYKSILENLKDREIILITEKNYKKWVEFPDHIQRKIDSGVITRTHLSDLIRLELLEHFGGTWIDATVFCSGPNIPAYILDSDLFIYQIMKPGLDGHAARISSWFITSCTNNPIILLTKELLYEYWRTHNHLVDYFLIHDMMELAIEAYPREWEAVVPVSSSLPHILLLRFSEKYNESVWSATKETTPFHKLTYKFTKEQKKDMEQGDTYYSCVIGKQ